MDTIKETSRTKVEYDNNYNTIRFIRKIDGAKSLIAGNIANDLMMDITSNVICDGTIDLIAKSKMN